MVTLFSICAVAGGTVLVCQFVMTLVGLGGETDVDAGHDVAFEVGEGGDAGDLSADGHASTAFFGLLTFRTVVAAVAFFGLGGLAANAAGTTPPQTMVIALASGAAAMYGIHRLLRLFADLRADGTVRLRDAVGCEGTVYLRIPGRRAGHGKVHLSLKQKTVELQAETAGAAIPQGATVKVQRLVGSDVVEVDVLGPATGTSPQLSDEAGRDRVRDSLPVATQS